MELTGGKLFMVANYSNSYISGINTGYNIASDNTILIWGGARAGMYNYGELAEGEYEPRNKITIEGPWNPDGKNQKYVYVCKGDRLYYYYDFSAETWKSTTDPYIYKNLYVTGEIFGHKDWKEAKSIIENSANFYVTQDGLLYAKKANISGTITADDGQIGSWTIGTITIESKMGEDDNRKI
jgi:hypothetical protein